MKRKKFQPRFILDPDYVETDEGQGYLEEIKVNIMQSGDDPTHYFPDEYGKRLPKEGGWIMLLQTVHVGRAITETETRHLIEAYEMLTRDARPVTAETEFIEIVVPHLSMWFAMPTLAINLRAWSGFHAHQAIIQTPHGSVNLWPSEYNIVKDINAYLGFIDEGAITINFMNESNKFDVDSLFYLMSRGLGRAQAQRLLLPDLKDPFYCYFTVDQSISDYFGEGFGQTRLTPDNHKRREEARRAKENHATSGAASRASSDGPTEQRG